ncbi:MAG: hypothetical protein KME41_03585 [Candidatus Thiodiazotropha sp. (ex Lucina pensylvanica)]|nr:hypothetical protein [Candidatus Thiodiazotropha sp. (ex Lucina pensylvanica)]MBT3033287.1 hypothetical protein [Candidatus Thiodiazotropha sp. (ex Lucina pensylvanica)]MBT3050972.1 hypothetical protein [Candidatus Thiodiazotropha sp. (ex Codakia orbicularis)]
MENWFFEIVGSLIILVLAVVALIVLIIVSWVVVSAVMLALLLFFAKLGPDKANKAMDRIRSCKHDNWSYKHEEKLAESIKDLKALEESVGISGEVPAVEFYHELSWPPGVVSPGVQEGVLRRVQETNQIEEFFEVIGNENDVSPYRYKVRDAYFSVKDIGKRKKLIELRRKVDKFSWAEHQVRCRERIRTARNAIEIIKGQIKYFGESKLLSKPILKGSFFFSIPLCFLGYWLFVSKVVGMLAGLVGGFILNINNNRYTLSTLVQMLSVSANELLDAKEDLRCMQVLQEVETFSSEEELSGERLRRVDEAKCRPACKILDRGRLERYLKGWAEIVSPYVI